MEFKDRQLDIRVRMNGLPDRNAHGHQDDREGNHSKQLGGNLSEVHRFSALNQEISGEQHENGDTCFSQGIEDLRKKQDRVKHRIVVPAVVELFDGTLRGQLDLEAVHNQMMDNDQDHCHNPQQFKIGHPLILCHGVPPFFSAVLQEIRTVAADPGAMQQK